MQPTNPIARSLRRPVPGTGQRNSNHPAASFVADWTALKGGDRIWIRRKDQTIVAGSVDQLTYDGNILWILPHDTSARKMYHRSDGDEIWTHHESLSALLDLPQ
jgi:hypothetical protein